MSIAAYKRTIRDSESPRQIERRILSQATAALESHADVYDATEERGGKLQILADGLRQALFENQQIWRHLRYDLIESDNQLPESLRASLLSLSLWVDQMTTDLMGGGTGVRALIDINQNVIDGLSGVSPATVVEA